MPAGDGQCEKRRSEIGMSEVRRRRMGMGMIDRNERLTVGICKTLGKVHSDKERAYKPRICGNADKLDLLGRTARLVERRIAETRYRLYMRTARYLGHDPSVQLMRLGLRRGTAGEYFALPLAHSDESNACIVTRRFDCKDQHALFLPSVFLSNTFILLFF